MWTHPGIDVFDELDSRAGLQPAHLIKWNPFLDEPAAVHELESCEDLVIGVLDHFLENKPSPHLHASTSLGPLPHFITGRPLRVRPRWRARRLTAQLPQYPDEHRPKRPVLLAVDQQLGEGAALHAVATALDRAGALSFQEIAEVVA